jgi:hypothetical protein
MTKEQIKPAKIVIFSNGKHRDIEFQRIIDAVDYFEQYDPPKYPYICKLFIRYNETMELHAEKEVKLFL